MIVGIGTDLIEVNRIANACKKEYFYKHCFTLLERNMIDGQDQRAAGNFAVKEAVAKAMGCGFREFTLLDIEVLRQENGKPYVVLHGKAKEIAKELGMNKLFVSITNTIEYASAFVVLEGDKDEIYSNC